MIRFKIITTKKISKIILKNEKNKLVYIALSADILHEGHLNIINKASKLGKVIVGLLTDEAIASFKKIPFKLSTKTNACSKHKKDFKSYTSINFRLHIKFKKDKA